MSVAYITDRIAAGCGDAKYTKIMPLYWSFFKEDNKHFSRAKQNENETTWQQYPRLKLFHISDFIIKFCLITAMCH